MEPAPEGVLARNLGLDLIVVVNKTDYMVELEKDFDYKDEHFDFIQQAVSSVNDEVLCEKSYLMRLLYPSGAEVLFAIWCQSILYKCQGGQKL